MKLIFRVISILMCMISLLLVIQLPFLRVQNESTSSLYPAAALASNFHFCCQGCFSLGTLTSILHFCSLASSRQEGNKKSPDFRYAIKSVATKPAISWPGLQLVYLSRPQFPRSVQTPAPARRWYGWPARVPGPRVQYGEARLHRSLVDIEQHRRCR